MPSKPQKPALTISAEATRGDLEKVLLPLVETDALAAEDVNGTLEQIISKTQLASLAANQTQLQSNTEIKKELTPEQKEELFSNLKTNFEADMNLHPGIKWEDVLQNLEKSSTATLVTLHKMQARGGEPTVTDYDEKTGKYRFDDCSAESPKVGRNTTYPKARQMAEDMGAAIMDSDHYKNKFQKLGKQFDLNSWNWLGSIEKMSRRVGLYGLRDVYGVRVGEYDADHYGDRGFRASLWV